MSEAPTRLAALSLNAARIRFENGSLGAAALTLRSSAERVGLIGNWRALFALLSSRAGLESGTATLLDMPYRAALASGAVGVAPLNPQLPFVWTCERYLKESAALLGLSKSEAASRSAAALERFEIAAHARRTLGSLSALDRRVLGIVRATLSEPRMLICEAPLHALPDDASALVSMALERAARGRTLVTSFHEVPEFGLERALFESGRELFLLDAAGVHPVALDDVEVHSELSVIVSENADAFAHELALRDVVAARLDQVEAAYAFVYARMQTDCVRFTVRAPDAAARRKILEASAAALAPLLELRPL
jgi:ABC-type uncharacterized transport system ATPase subunit